MRPDPPTLVSWIGRSARIDGGDVVGRVTRVEFSESGAVNIRLEWWNNGALSGDWFAWERIEVQP